MKATFFLLAVFCVIAPGSALADEPLPKACIDGEGPGWRVLGEQDFVNVNCNPDTWSFGDGMIRCTGTPTGVMRMKEPITNFELVVQWKHLKPAGNSGVFVWASEESINNLHVGKHYKRLPDGIEVQILDHGYHELYASKNQGKKGNFFSTN